MRRSLACLLLAASAGVSAQTFPSKPLHIVVPYAAGGAVDTIARAFAPHLSTQLGQPVIVDDKPGAGANIGADAVAKSPPDGYTVLLSPAGLAISPAMYRRLPFDAAKDFAAVSQLMSSWLILVTAQKLPAKTVAELLALAKANPGRLNYGSTGLGSPPHLAGELLRQLGHIDIVHVPYKGDAPMYAALLAGEVDLGFGPLAGALPHIRSGRLHLLAITDAQRSPLLPEAPTLVESGLPDFRYSGWIGVLGPAGMPRPVLERLHDEWVRALATADIRERMPAWGYEPVGSSPEAFDARFKSDLALYARIVRDAKVPLQDY
ncbi:MAG TPA: tripartite tricarboxylate transporter substrate binding protein [Burkholderiales bacterium]|nr:tripartite tricarboxylate transporter substrate binding protein [Burkholderiales bacterium]